MEIKKSATLIYDQLSSVLYQLTNEQYTYKIGLLNASLGGHTRHIINFYEAIVKGNDCAEIDYDNRKREELLEQNIEFALSRFKSSIEALECINEQVDFVLNSSFDVTETQVDYKIKTSAGRELLYAFDHAIHHMAILKIGLKVAFPHVQINEDFGVAPSTLKFRKTCAQ